MALEDSRLKGERLEVMSNPKIFILQNGNGGGDIFTPTHVKRQPIAGKTPEKSLSTHRATQEGANANVDVESKALEVKQSLSCFGVCLGQGLADRMPTESLSSLVSWGAPCTGA